MENCCKDERTTQRSNEEKTKLVRRLNIIEGQIRGINQMISQDRYCGDILTQLSAVINSLQSVSNIVLKTHMHTCMVEEILKGNEKAIDEVITLIGRFN